MFARHAPRASCGGDKFPGTCADSGRLWPILARDRPNWSDSSTGITPNLADVGPRALRNLGESVPNSAEIGPKSNAVCDRIRGTFYRHRSTSAWDRPNLRRPTCGGSEPNSAKLGQELTAFGPNSINIGQIW